MNNNKTTHCLNCGKYIGETNFCHNCGQMNSDRRLTLRQLLHDFFGDYFTFDSKFFRSIFPLLSKPGHLTREYVSGRRVSYVLPLRLYIFTTFVFFFVLALNTKFDTKEINSVRSAEYVMPADSLNAILNQYGAAIPESVRESLFEQLDSTFVQSYSSENDGPKVNFKYDEDDENDSHIERYLKNKAYYLESLGGKGTAVFVKSIINQIPKVMFVMLPFFALILKLLYVRHRILYIEHFIFALHMHSLTFMLLIITVFLTKWYVILIVILGILVYLFLSMRNFYGQGIIKTWIKMHLLLSLYFVALLPAALLLLILAMVSV
ncbi:DUF3667 domain-containing protein [candidate division KSB1 bacterium]|nr:DUF3667 domain-containing protein [candidate division KSB1 bacterium]